MRQRSSINDKAWYQSYRIKNILADANKYVSYEEFIQRWGRNNKFSTLENEFWHIYLMIGRLFGIDAKNIDLTDYVKIFEDMSDKEIRRTYIETGYYGSDIIDTKIYGK